MKMIPESRETLIDHQSLIAISLRKSVSLDRSIILFKVFMM